MVAVFVIIRFAAEKPYLRLEGSKIKWRVHTRHNATKLRYVVFEKTC